jgi:hypothetical protein
MASFILAFSNIQCMLDYEVICRCYDEWNKMGSTMKCDIE